MSIKKFPHPCDRGYPEPFGATMLAEGINFSFFSRHADLVFLVLDWPSSEDDSTIRYQIPLSPEFHKTGDIWHILIYSDNTRFSYGFRVEGDQLQDEGLVYDPATILIDPFCHKLRPRIWGGAADYGKTPCCRVIQHDFDWQQDRPLKTPLADTIIYELHVRGFTNHESSSVTAPGTYHGIIEKIPYLQSLGITAVELMPVMEFDENDNTFLNPETGEPLKNFWGYNPVSFFALKSGFSSDTENHINEFKQMVLELHQAGIEVILDMVYNHTGEGGYDGTTSSFRGIDNLIFYLLDPETREYLNFSGCGNTMNCNHPVVRELIRESLRYWVMEMHIDGFRFDLASIMGRDQTGEPLPNPPMVEMIAEDPILRDTKIIAEAWDAAGLYQVGTFSEDSRWAEWNGRYRDDVRSFMAGNDDSVTKLATRIAGSSDLYQTSFRKPINSINFITSHDGFTLHDLVSYNEKHNRQNGEKNRDGDDHNISWNSGVEGESNDPEIVQLRIRRTKTFALILFISQGVPMIVAGDEFGRSQRGNNNCWCQDNPTSWLDWNLADSNHGLLRFFRLCINLRKTNPIFRRVDFFQHLDASGCETDHDIRWQGLQPCEEDWSSSSHHLGMILNGKITENNNAAHFFIMLNGSRNESATFHLPKTPDHPQSHWRKIIDTSLHSPEDFVTPGSAQPVADDSQMVILPMSGIVLQSVPNPPDTEK